MLCLINHIRLYNILLQFKDRHFNLNNQISALSSKHVRGKFEIISALIIIAQQPVTLSKLVYSIGLSHVTLKRYIQVMLNSGLISNNILIRGKKKRNYSAYITTEKGNRFLEVYCTNLLLLYEDNLQDSLINKHLLQYCMNNKTTLMSNLPSILEPEIYHF